MKMRDDCNIIWRSRWQIVPFKLILIFYIKDMNNGWIECHWTGWFYSLKTSLAMVLWVRWNWCQMCALHSMSVMIITSSILCNFIDIVCMQNDLVTICFTHSNHNLHIEWKVRYYFGSFQSGRTLFSFFEFFVFGQRRKTFSFMNLIHEKCLRV